jgi:hypothetical protein
MTEAASASEAIYFFNRNKTIENIVNMCQLMEKCICEVLCSENCNILISVEFVASMD